MPLAIAWLTCECLIQMFAIDGNFYGVPDDEWIDDKPKLPDEQFTLDEVLGTTVKGFLHKYDYTTSVTAGTTT